MDIKGFVVDYSFSHPAPSSIKAAGYLGVVRYLGYDFKYEYDPGRNRRTICPRERDELFAQGLDIALVWETTANMVLGGSSAGAKDGVEANRQADYLGFPKDRPIYIAVDFQAYGYQYATIDGYMKAFNAAGRPVRLYGHYDIIEYFGGGWQCAAWSGQGSGTGGSSNSGGRDMYRRVSSKALMYQRIGYVLGNSCDENEVYVEDWGQWKYSGASQPSTPVQDSEDKMKAVYKFPDKNEIWMLNSGYVADAELEDDNGTPQPVTVNKVTEYFRLIPNPEALEQLYQDGHLKRGFVRFLASNDNALDAYWHSLPHVR